MPGKYPHIVTIKRPPAAAEGHGALQGTPTDLLREVPCAIKTLTARESEVARQNAPSITYTVELYGDPAKPMHFTDWLDWQGRKLQIVGINDRKQNGVELELTCVEVVRNG